ncbi:hypothetical protein ID866_5435 [Astraeus odoratus]|nr:hypothetical protein ID866_5435 [Astraeus odoratus]
MSDLLMMFTTLGREGHIRRSLLATQTLDGGIDLQKWKIFCDNFNVEVDNTNLLVSLFTSTVLVASNISFVTIQTVDNTTFATSYVAQGLSYLSLVLALLSIAIGMTLRTPRLLVSILIGSAVLHIF